MRSFRTETLRCRGNKSLYSLESGSYLCDTFIINKHKQKWFMDFRAKTSTEAKHSTLPCRLSWDISRALVNSWSNLHTFKSAADVGKDSNSTNDALCLGQVDDDARWDAALSRDSPPMHGMSTFTPWTSVAAGVEGCNLAAVGDTLARGLGTGLLSLGDIL